MSAPLGRDAHGRAMMAESEMKPKAKSEMKPKAESEMKPKAESDDEAKDGIR